MEQTLTCIRPLTEAQYTFCLANGTPINDATLLGKYLDALVGFFLNPVIVAWVDPDKTTE